MRKPLETEGLFNRKRLKKIDVVSSNPTSSEKTQKDSSKSQHFCPSFKMNNYQILERLFTIFFAIKKADLNKIRLFYSWQLFGYHMMASPVGLEPTTSG